MQPNRSKMSHMPLEDSVETTVTSLKLQQLVFLWSNLLRETIAFVIYVQVRISKSYKTQVMEAWAWIERYEWLWSDSFDSHSKWFNYRTNRNSTLLFERQSWHSYSYLERGNLSWEVVSVRLPVGESVGHFLDLNGWYGMSSPLWAVQSSINRKQSNTVKNIPQTLSKSWEMSQKQHSSMVLALRFLLEVPPFSEFLLWLHSMDFYLWYVNQINTFLPKWVLVMVFFTAIGTKLRHIYSQDWAIPQLNTLTLK